MNHVVEHVLDPREVVRRTFAMLAPGGHVIGQLPTRTSWERRAFGPAWAGYHFPRHLQIFSRPALTRLLEEAGFVDVRIVRVGRIPPLARSMIAIARRP
jgi:2-polyprenyl-6-hydroxyphenyl methylase/3-demethylubiquinone-9 3-methyltransferase